MNPPIYIFAASCIACWKNKSVKNLNSIVIIIIELINAPLFESRKWSSNKHYCLFTIDDRYIYIYIFYLLPIVADVIISICKMPYRINRGRVGWIIIQKTACWFKSLLLRWSLFSSEIEIFTFVATGNFQLKIVKILKARETQMMEALISNLCRDWIKYEFFSTFFYRLLSKLQSL